MIEKQHWPKTTSKGVVNSATEVDASKGSYDGGGYFWGDCTKSGHPSARLTMDGKYGVPWVHGFCGIEGRGEG